MNKYDWDFGVPDYVLQIQEALNTLTASATAISKTWEAAVSKYDYSVVHTALNTWLANHNSISDQISSVTKSILPLVDTSVYGALKDLNAISTALQSVDWSWLSEVQPVNDENNDATATTENQEVTSDIRTAIAEDITEVLAEPKSMHITSRRKYLEWIKESPEHALLFLGTLISFLTLLLQALSFGLQIWQARPVKDSQVYQEPVSTSNVVYNLTVENNVTVVGDVPYYYEVEFVNPETGEPVIGYIYKGNLTEVVPDAPEDVEASEATPDTAESQREPTE